MTVTPNFGFTLPEVGADKNIWGTLLNTNWSSVDTLLQETNDSKVSIDGDTMTGTLIVAGGDIIVDQTGYTASAFVSVKAEIGEAAGFSIYDNAGAVYRDVIDIDATGAFGIGSEGWADVQGFVGDWAFLNPVKMANVDYSIVFPGTLFDWQCGHHDSTGYFRWHKEGVTVAQLDGAGTGLVSTNTVVTREKGDGRYLQLSGGFITGNLDISGALNTTNTGNASNYAVTLTNSTSVDVYDALRALPDGGVAFYTVISGVGTLVARVDAPGAVAAFGTTIITRDKGDGRYTQAVTTTALLDQLVTLAVITQQQADDITATVLI